MAWKRSVNSLVASLLILFIAVAGSILIYQYTSHLYGEVDEDRASFASLKAEGSAQSGTCLFVFVKNMGAGSFRVSNASLYIYRGGTPLASFQALNSPVIEPKGIGVLVFDTAFFSLKMREDQGFFDLVVKYPGGAGDVLKHQPLQRFSSKTLPVSLGVIGNITLHRVFYDADADGFVDGAADNITSALQHIGDGGVLLVYPGIYDERVSADKHFVMLAAGCGGERVVTGGLSVHLSSPGILYVGGIVFNSSSPISSYISMTSQGNRVLFENNTFTNNKLIVIDHASDNLAVFRRNVFRLNSTLLSNYASLLLFDKTGNGTAYLLDNVFESYTGKENPGPSEIRYLEGARIGLASGEVVVSGNVFSLLGRGVYLIYAGSSTGGVRISGNLFSSNIHGVSTLEYRRQYINVFVTGNVFQGSQLTDSHLALAATDRGAGLQNILVSGNRFDLETSDSTKTALIEIVGDRDHINDYYNIVVEGNWLNHTIIRVEEVANISVRGNTLRGYKFINIIDARAVLVENNRLLGGGDGIWVAEPYSGSSGVVLVRNNYIEGGLDGVRLIYKVNNATVEGNTIVDTRDLGIGISLSKPHGGSYSLEGIVVTNNTLINADYGSDVWYTNCGGVQAAQLSVCLDSSIGSINVSKIKIHANNFAFKDISLDKSFFVSIRDNSGSTNTTNPLDLTGNTWTINGTLITDPALYAEYVRDHTDKTDGGYIKTEFYETP